MRRIAILLALLIVLVVLIAAATLTANWHYAVPVAPGALAYAATFDDLLTDWDQNPGRLSAQAVDGVLRLTIGDTNDGLYSAARPFFSDFDLRLQARAVEGPDDNGYGVIFRLHDRYDDHPLLTDDLLNNVIVRRLVQLSERYNYYLFLVSSDGFYQVARVFDGGEMELSTWIESSLVNSGIGAQNDLRVVAHGDEFQFFINGTQVELCIPDDPSASSTYLSGECLAGQMVDTLVDDSIPSGRLGVVARAYRTEGVIVEFDNVLVYGPMPPKTPIVMPIATVEVTPEVNVESTPEATES